MEDLQKKLKQLIDRLVALGENGEELRFWGSVFDDLNEEERAKIMTILETELAKLEHIS
jgi:hypothetical protein